MLDNIPVPQSRVTLQLLASYHAHYNGPNGGRFEGLTIFPVRYPSQRTVGQGGNKTTGQSMPPRYPRPALSGVGLDPLRERLT